MEKSKLDIALGDVFDCKDSSHICAIIERMDAIFPPISFKVTIKGVEEMNYRIESKPVFRVIGIRQAMSADAVEGFKVVPLFWQDAAAQIPQIASSWRQ